MRFSGTAYAVLHIAVLAILLLHAPAHSKGGAGCTSEDRPSVESVESAVDRARDLPKTAWLAVSRLLGRESENVEGQVREAYSTVKQWVSRARQRLAAHLAQDSCAEYSAKTGPPVTAYPISMHYGALEHGAYFEACGCRDRYECDQG